MADLGIYRALAGGAGLAACIALLIDQARSDATEFAAIAPATISARSAAAADISQPHPASRAVDGTVRSRPSDFTR